MKFSCTQAIAVNLLLPIGLSLSGGGCSTTEVVLVPFSRVAQAEVLLVADAASCDTADIMAPDELVSTTNAKNHVGTIEITPQCGVPGTTHQLLVTLVDPDSHEDVVAAATLTVRPDDDPEREVMFDLFRDSANPAQFGLDLDSYGEPDRTDIFEFQLLQAEEVVGNL